MNSRPLVPISTDPNDVTALTTGHFLIGEPLTAQADGEPSQQPQSLGQRWQAVSKLKHAFWTQWSTDYLQQLQHRQKWRRSSANVKEGELVLIKEDNTPVLQWPLGRINKTIVFFVRVVEVKKSKLAKTDSNPLIVYYNLQLYWKDMSTFSTGTTKIGHLCKQFPGMYKHV